MNACAAATSTEASRGVHLRKDAQTAATADWNAVDVGGPAFVLAVDTAGKTIPNRILKVCEKEKNDPLGAFFL